MDCFKVHIFQLSRHLAEARENSGKVTSEAGNRERRLMSTKLALGLMSGTSLDGIDAALVQTDGEHIVVPRGALSLPYRDDQRLLLQKALETARTWPANTPMPEVITRAEQELTQAHAAAINALLAQTTTKPEDVDIVGFHGQTVLHRPDEGRTEQIGLGALLADSIGIDVVYDFRSADVAAGGQGAPLAPLYHNALASSLENAGPVAVLNVGGVSNVTYLGQTENDLIAFDTGPGNALLDDWMTRHTGARMDEDGKMAKSGKPDEAVLATLMDNPYFEAKAPKSLDRLDFHARAQAATQHLSPADGAATLTHFTARANAAALAHLPEAPRLWIVCGGGRRNPALLEALQTYLPGDVKPAEAVGWRGDDVEAEAFAYLAVRSLKQLPLSVPGTTGVPAPLTGGVLAKTRKGAS